MRPSIGRTVHYVAHGTPVRADGTQAYPSVCRAAIITAVDDGTIRLASATLQGPASVSLCVLNPTGLFFNQGVEQDEDGHAGGTWHWPERVEEAN